MIGMNGLNAYYDQRGEAQHKYFDTSQPLMGVGGCGCANGMGTVIDPDWAKSTTGTTPSPPPAPPASGIPMAVYVAGGAALVGLAIYFATRK